MKDENTIYDDEKTQYQNRDDEATQYDDSYEKTANSAVPKQHKKPQRGMWQKAAAGAGTGIVLGVAATMLTSGTTPASQTANENHSHPDWTDGEITVATNVTDDMTFAEAFDAARTETGSGGVFEWHGYIYSTYTEDEWNSMTAEQRAEYGSHLKWDDEVSVVDSEPEVEVLGANVDAIEDAGIDGDDVVIVDVDVEPDILAEPDIHAGQDMADSVGSYDSGADIDYLADNGMDDYVDDAYTQDYYG